jgi:hypothetical protein
MAISPVVPLKEFPMVTTSSPSRTNVAALMTDLDEIWHCLDTLFTDLTPNDWTRSHGKRWTFADLPYHLSYFDRAFGDLVAGGATTPPAKRWLMHSEAEIDAWNARMFAQRPARLSVAASLEAMRESRDLIRQTLDRFNDPDLDQPVWSPFFGWCTRRDAIFGVTAHSFNHFMEARIRLKRTSPVPSPGLVHRSLDFYLRLLVRFLDKERAAGRQFTAIMTFSGAGGGSWMIRVEGGTCIVTEGRTERPDLEITQSPETFVAMTARIANPIWLMLTGKMNVKGMRGLPTFGKLFPSPAANPGRTWSVVTDLSLTTV